MEYYGYFNGLEYDEEFVALVNRILVKNGVFDDGLRVSASGGMTVQAAEGAAIVGGFIYYNDEPMTLAIATANASLPRIDSVMLRWDIPNRKMNLTVVTGTAQSNPKAPAPVRNGTYYDMQIAAVRVNGGTASITAADITDTRPNKSVCGITSGYNSVDIDAMMSQYNAEFTDWFAEIKDQLSSDAAGNLQNQCTELAEQLSLLELSLTADGAGAHNSIYRGKNLGAGPTPEQYAAIADGTFKDLYIGDYWVKGSLTYRIACFDYFLNSGNTACTRHHVLIVPDQVLYTYAMNDSNTTAGGYVGSKMYTEGLNSAKSTIKADFAGHVLKHREYFINAVTDGHPAGGAWLDSEVDLMNENMVYGTNIFLPRANGSEVYANHTIDKVQLPLFALRPDLIIVSNRKPWWLRDAVSGSVFALVGGDGSASAYNASHAHGVRPAFCIF